MATFDKKLVEFIVGTAASHNLINFPLEEMTENRALFSFGTINGDRIPPLKGYAILEMMLIGQNSGRVQKVFQKIECYYLPNAVINILCSGKFLQMDVYGTEFHMSNPANSGMVMTTGLSEPHILPFKYNTSAVVEVIVHPHSNHLKLDISTNDIYIEAWETYSRPYPGVRCISVFRMTDDGEEDPEE